MIIAVDFDGAIVENRYPSIGNEIPFAIATLKKLQAEHHLLILWSVREGQLLEEAVEYCRRKGLEFYAVNANYPDEEINSDSSCSCRKVKADFFIDNRNIGGLPDWKAIYEMINNRWSYGQYLAETQKTNNSKQSSFWKQILRR